MALSSSPMPNKVEFWFASRCLWRRRCRMPEPEISVLLVDDHSLVRKGFRRLLEDAPGIRVVGEASDGHEAVEAVRALKPQGVVVDFALLSMNGAVATRRIRELYPQTAVLILSMHANRAKSITTTCGFKALTA